MLHDPDVAVTLLKRALELLNDRPNFGLRRDATATSYKLAADIDRFFAKEGID